MTNLRSWLRRAPHPVAILADDQRVLVPDTPRKWSELEETLTALAPGKLVALDGQGNPLRAVTLDDDEPAAAAATAGGKNPLTNDLQVLSKLLADAYRTGAETAMNAMKSSIEENTKLVKLLADRLSAIEVAWQRSLTTHAKMVVDLAEARSQGGGGEDALMSSLLPAMLAGAHGDQPPANGKGR